MTPEPIRFERPLRGVSVLSTSSGRATPLPGGTTLGQAARDRHTDALASAREEGYRQGRADADVAFSEQLMTQRQEVLGLAEGVVRRLEEQHTALRAQARGCVPGLVMQIVRRVLAGCEPDAGRVRRLVEETLAETPSDALHAVEISLYPPDLAMLETMGAATLKEKYPRVVWRADPSLSCGDCMARGNFGLIDARAETKLKVIEQWLVAS